MEDVVIKILPDFTIWKLHSFKEILIFFLALATGLVVFRWKWLQMKKARTPEMAMKRVKKAIREGSHKKTYFFVPPKGSLTGVDLIALLPGKALLLRVIHKGYRIYGHNQDSTWRVTDNASSLIVKNPVRALEESEAVFKETLAKEGAHHVKVETIAVFADNYAEPSFFTEEDVLPHLASTQTLKKEVQRIVKEEKTPVSEGLKSACLKHYVPADE